MPIPRIATSIDELAEDIGFTAAVLLAGAYGGCRLFIPREMSRAHPIARLFEAGGAGYAPAMTLSDLHGDTTIGIPILRAYEDLRQIAHAKVLVDGGYPVAAVAAAAGISASGLRAKLAELAMIGLTGRAILKDQRRQARFLAAVQSHQEAMAADAKEAEPNEAEQHAAKRPRPARGRKARNRAAANREPVTTGGRP